MVPALPHALSLHRPAIFKTLHLVHLGWFVLFQLKIFKIKITKKTLENYRRSFFQLKITSSKNYRFQPTMEPLYHPVYHTSSRRFGLPNNPSKTHFTVNNNSGFIRNLKVNLISFFRKSIVQSCFIHVCAKPRIYENRSFLTFRI